MDGDYKHLEQGSIVRRPDVRRRPAWPTCRTFPSLLRAASRPDGVHRTGRRPPFRPAAAAAHPQAPPQGQVFVAGRHHAPGGGPPTAGQRTRPTAETDFPTDTAELAQRTASADPVRGVRRRGGDRCLPPDRRFTDQNAAPAYLQRCPVRPRPCARDIRNHALGTARRPPHEPSPRTPNAERGPCGELSGPRWSPTDRVAAQDSDATSTTRT